MNKTNLKLLYKDREDKYNKVADIIAGIDHNIYYNDYLDEINEKLYENHNDYSFLNRGEKVLVDNYYDGTRFGSYYQGFNKLVISKSNLTDPDLLAQFDEALGKAQITSIVLDKHAFNLGNIVALQSINWEIKGLTKYEYIDNICGETLLVEKDGMELVKRKL